MAEYEIAEKAEQRKTNRSFRHAEGLASIAWVSANRHSGTGVGLDADLKRRPLALLSKFSIDALCRHRIKLVGAPRRLQAQVRGDA